jgi:hypothetical protein
MTSEEPDGPPSEAIERSREHRAGVREASSELATALSKPASRGVETWAKETTERLNALRRAFAHHAEVSEGPGGLLAQIEADSPGLAHVVAQIREEHRQITAQLAAVQLVVDHIETVDHVFAARKSGLDALRSIAEHRHRGADLLGDAFAVDIEGTSDEPGNRRGPAGT